MANNNITAIKLDRVRFLKYGHKALKAMLALTGKSLEQMNMEHLDLEEIEKILYCGLLSDAKMHNETLKLEEMEDLLDQAENFQLIIDKMGEAFEKAFGGNAEGKN